jgi:hypothetical protein
METRYVTDEKGECVGVILDVREYERLMGALEDLADLRAADEALEAIARGEEELLPLDEPSMRWKRSGAGYGKRESRPAKWGKVPRLVRGD